MKHIQNDTDKTFIKYLVPSVSGAVVVTLYSAVDTIAIGQGVGPMGTAACAVFLPIFFISEFLGLLCGIGGSVLMSKSRGEGNRQKEKAYFFSSMIYTALLTIAVWIITIIFQKPIYAVFGASPEVMPYAYEYGRLIVYFLPTFVLTPCLSCFLRNDGVPGLVMITTLSGAVINMLGDWLFVFPMKMGMTGAALATVAGSCVQVIIFLSYIIFSKNTSLRPAVPKNIIKSFYSITVNGFGSGISQLALIAVTFTANNRIMKYGGEASLAVYGMIGTIAALFQHIYTGVGQAAQPIASEGLGSADTFGYLRVYTIGMRSIYIFGILFTLSCLIFPSDITAVFMKLTPEVAAAAPPTVRIYSLSFIALGINTFITLYLQSVMQPAMSATVALMRGLILNTVFLCVFPLFFGEMGIWWAITAAEAITAIAALLYMNRFKRITSRKKTSPL